MASGPRTEPRPAKGAERDPANPVGAHPRAAGSLTSIRPSLSRLEHGLPRRRRAAFDRTVAKAEPGAVAGTDDRLALDLTTAEQAATVRAAIVQRAQMPVLPQKQNGRVARHPAGQLAVLQLPVPGALPSRSASIRLGPGGWPGGDGARVARPG